MLDVGEGKPLHLLILRLPDVGAEAHGPFAAMTAAPTPHASAAMAIRSIFSPVSRI